MNDLLIGDFLRGFDAQYYPGDFLEKYEPVECLSHNQTGETLLVRDRFNTCFIAKCYTDRSFLSGATESGLLKDLRHEGLAAFKDEYTNDIMLCIVREYMPGMSLDRIKTPLSDRQVISVGLQLCGILSYLHGQARPIIHRDIKPQNIIISESGKVSLIDFGISRRYDAADAADTVFFGTQEFAPPEQYGFSQTDPRSDIFSLGVVLVWLLTGKTNAQNISVKNRRLRRIVKKCTAFSPKDRYPTAASVCRALTGADGSRRKKALLAGGAAAALLIALAAGFIIGRFTDFRPALFYDNRAAAFAEPLIEQAVRLQLGKTDAESVYAAELDQVEELYFFGGRAVGTWEEFDDLCINGDAGADTADGAASALRDIAKLKNLKKLCFGNMDIGDISALSGLTELEYLVICNCPVEDISVLANLPGLEHLELRNCTEIDDLSPLDSCSKLSELALPGCRAVDFSVLSELGDLRFLALQGVELDLFLPYLTGKTVRELSLATSRWILSPSFPALPDSKTFVLTKCSFPPSRRSTVCRS
jgi:hypothetical protein